ncbi:Small heat shock protein HSP [Parasponia andersonii]|uniref:Small heat shock protein HSP n=1 Tax=Parasponia andersonii TaxID=3476 RepID=A0A2P5B0P3_PARAD|nr:Small heat shock protein HSP [Parasponia andersonii]
MSQALSNLSLFLPLSSRQTTNSIKPQSFSRIVKAMAGEPRDNLDHLQRTPKQHHQTPPKKRVTTPTAPLGLWDRFPTARTVQQMMETMERMMEDPFEYAGGWPSPLPSETGPYSRGRTPWEIKEGETEYKMRFDMPGMTKEDVKVWVEEKMLVVKAQKEPRKKGDQEVDFNGGEEEWSAKSYGRYSCRIALPENIQFENIRAEVRDGVLYITIPKATAGSKILDINVQ